MKFYTVKRPYTERTYGYAYFNLSEEEYDNIVKNYNLNPKDSSFKDKLFNILERTSFLEFQEKDWSDFCYVGDVELECEEEEEEE